MQNNFPKIPFFLSMIFFILSCLGFFFVYREINNKKQESQLAEIQWKTEADRREEIKALDNSVKIIEPQRAQLETHFAKSSDIVPFLDTIEGLAPKTDTTAEVTSVEIPKDLTGLLVGMKASGSFSGLHKFLTLLENSPYELEFVSMDIRKESGPETAGDNVPAATWNVVLKIKLLSFIH